LKVYRYKMYIVAVTMPDLRRVFRSGKPVYLALADVLGAAIADGNLAPGERLPTHRALAEKLGVTTGTVTRAYLEAEARGLVQGEVGRGTFVRAGSAVAGRFDFGAAARPGVIDLAYNLPPVGSPEELRILSDGLAALAGGRNILRFMHYQPAQVLDEYRETGRGWLARCGVEAPAEEIVLTAGSQHALFAVLAALASPGDEVLTEALTYPGLQAAAELLHLRLRGVALDREGLRPDALDAACAGGARLVYLVPTLQNPTTATMSTRRRRAVAEVARQRGLAIVEDDIHALLLPDGERPKPLATLLPEQGYYIANTAKLLAPALRVSFLRAPRQAVKRIAAAVHASLWMSPPIGVELVGHWMRNGDADRLLELRRAEAAARQAVAAEALKGCRYRAHPASYHLWLELPRPWRAESFAARALERGVAVTAADSFAVGRSAAPRAVRVCLGGAPDRERLAAALASLRQTMADGPSRPTALV
jgi:DNA-binding transcriptional MocR family regulator